MTNANHFGAMAKLTNTPNPGEMVWAVPTGNRILSAAGYSNDIVG
jgi:hypothetical protein